MKKNNAFLISLTLLLTLPLVAYAQGVTSLNTSFGQIGGSINAFTSGIVKSLITLFATMAMAAFFFGIVKYIWGFRNGEEKEITNGKKFMIWSLLALFVMFSVWGIIIFFQNTLGIGGNNRILIPEVQIGGSAGSANNSPLTPSNVGANCTSNPECSGGTTCKNFTCQF